jgi:nitrite reductase (NADH) small subunit
MTLLDRSATLSAVCPLDRLAPDRGVAALVDGVPVAVFRLATGELAAIDNVDPVTGASVLSRGIVGDADGTPTVASPLYKQRYDLRTGACLDDANVRVRVHDVRVVDGVVHVALRS